MPKLQNLSFIFCALLLLTGCESLRHTFNTDDTDHVHAKAPETDLDNDIMVSSAENLTTTHNGPQSGIIVTELPPADLDPNVTGRLSSAEGIQPLSQAPYSSDLMVMTQKLAGGSVEIFPLDQPIPARQPPMQMDQQNLQQQTMGLRAVSEPNVTLFPVVNNGAITAQTQTGLWPNAVLPQATSSASASDIVMAASARSGGTNPTKIYFEHGSARIGSGDKNVIKSASQTAKFSPVSRVSVEGHASRRANTGSPVQDRIVNLKESMNRAFEVSKVMMMEGVPAEKIKTTAWGDTKPPVDGSASEEKQRRVEIYTGSGY